MELNWFSSFCNRLVVISIQLCLENYGRKYPNLGRDKKRLVCCVGALTFDVVIPGRLAIEMVVGWRSFAGFITTVVSSSSICGRGGRVMTTLSSNKVLSLIMSSIKTIFKSSFSKIGVGLSAFTVNSVGGTVLSSTSISPGDASSVSSRKKIERNFQQYMSYINIGQTKCHKKTICNTFYQPRSG